MTGKDRKSYLGYLNKLVKKYNNAYYCSIGKKPINPDYSALTEEIEMNLKLPKFKVGYRVKITKYKNILNKGYTNNWSREIFVIDYVLKTNPWMCKIKYIIGEKIVISWMGFLKTMMEINI